MASSLEYEWQKQRRRTDVSFDGAVPVRGFGPSGAHTLWIVSPVVKRQYVFKDGKPTAVEIESGGEALATLRKQTLSSIDLSRRDGRAFITVDVRLMGYAADVIRMTYNVSDDDLTFLLCESFKWIEPIIIHLLGGESSRDELAKFGTAQQQSVIDYAHPGTPDAEPAIDHPVIVAGDDGADDPLPLISLEDR